MSKLLPLLIGGLGILLAVIAGIILFVSANKPKDSESGKITASAILIFVGVFLFAGAIGLSVFLDGDKAAGMVTKDAAPALPLLLLA